MMIQKRIKQFNIKRTMNGEAEMKTIAVIGSGIMGSGIAYAAATNHFQVYLHDIQAEALEKAKAYIQAEMKKAVQSGVYDSTGRNR